jgi:ankyrin repeat protein
VSCTKLKSIKLLTELENINTKDVDGDSLLINAAEKDWVNEKDIDFIKALITKKANINQPGRAGQTPLMHIAMTRFTEANQQAELIQFFIENNANLEAKDVFGKTALDYAREKNQVKADQALEKHTKRVPIQLTIQEQIVTLNNLSSALSCLANRI